MQQYVTMQPLHVCTNMQHQKSNNAQKMILLAGAIMFYFLKLFQLLRGYNENNYSAITSDSKNVF